MMKLLVKVNRYIAFDIDASQGEVIEVSDERGTQLLSDHPTWFELIKEEENESAKELKQVRNKMLHRRKTK